MKKRLSCFVVAVVLLTLTLWATACGSTSAEAGTADRPRAGAMWRSWLKDETILPVLLQRLPE